MLFSIRRPMISVLVELKHGFTKWSLAWGVSSKANRSEQTTVQRSGIVRWYTATEDDQIIRSYHQGLSWQITASQVGRSKHSVRCRCSSLSNANPTNRFSQLWTSGEDAVLLKARSLGESWSTVAAKIGRSIGSVETRFSRIVPRDLRHKYARTDLFTPAEDLAILRLRDVEHRSYRYIGRQIGRSDTSVRNRYSFLCSSISHDDKERVSGPFSGSEDDRIVRMIEQEGLSFHNVAQSLLRPAWSVKDRYYDFLRSSPQRTRQVMQYTDAEDARILELRNAGFGWKEMSVEIQPRSPRGLQNRYARLLDKKSWSEATGR